MFENLLIHPSTLSMIAHVLMVTLVSVRVIMKRPATGIALSWLLLIAAIPGLGVALYLLIGERRIGQDRARGIKQLRMDYRSIADIAIEEGLTDVDWSRHSASIKAMNRLGTSMVGSPTVCGSKLTLFSNTDKILDAIRCDIESAKVSVLIEFYIWNAGGKSDDVLEAVIDAAKRGVCCCVLIDALGARPWWKGPQPQRLRDAGVEVRPALQVGLFRTFVGRTDLRLHRKIVVVDGDVAWTGSMNMVDPGFFKQDSGVGQWVDAMVRTEGSVVVPLAATMIGDWVLESGEALEDVITRCGIQIVDNRGTADIQVIPSGPGQTQDGLLQMILAMINAASKELILTTPYLVPDDAILRALRGAAARGVEVRLIVPEKVDSFLTRYASRSYFEDLLNVGVEIYQYRGGLLHTKSIMADGKISMFGTVNLDMRSLWLNYEVALFVYDSEFGSELRDFQQSYISDSAILDSEVWKARSFWERFLENTLRLMSPLL